MVNEEAKPSNEASDHPANQRAWSLAMQSRANPTRDSADHLDPYNVNVTSIYIHTCSSSSTQQVAVCYPPPCTDALLSDTVRLNTSSTGGKSPCALCDGPPARPALPIVGPRLGSSPVALTSCPGSSCFSS